MAAFENQGGPDLDLFHGQSWAEWQTAVEAESSGKSKETKLFRQSKEVAKLKRQDFGLFGFCPAKDDFYVVVCEHCHLPIKPQAFFYHIEKYHKEKSRTEATEKSPDPNEKSTLFSTLTALSCDNSVCRSSTPSETCSTNSAEFSRSKSSLPYHVNSVGKKVFEDSVPASPSGKKRVSSHDVFKATKSPSKAKQLKLDKESSPLVRKHSSKNKLSSSKKLASDQKQSANLSSSRKSSSPFQAKDHITLPTPTSIAAETSFSLPIKQEQIFLNSAPVVVLEKPIKIEKPIAVPYIQKRESTNLGDNVSYHSKSLPTTPYRQYAHHHNPQLDIVKSPDRGFDKSQKSSVNCEGVRNQLAVKPKKIPATLKVRDYDPNKHCGVWMPSENTNCTRSFTCKFHAKTSKRNVPGRKYPFDEMLKEHLRARNKAKEKSEVSVPKKISSPRVSDGSASSSAGVAHSENSMQQQVSASKIAMQSLPMQPPNLKLTSPPASKSKPSVQLFPRPASVSLVDLWQDPMVQYEALNKDYNQCFTTRHPSPLMLCHFGSRKMGANHLSYNRAADFQWNVLSSMSKQVRKQNLVNLLDAGQTTAHFTSISPASAPVLNRIKTEKETLAQQRAFSNTISYNSNCNVMFNYARTKVPSFRLLNYQNQRFRSQSIESEALRRSHSKISAPAGISGRRNAVVPASSSSDALFVPMPLDHRLSNDTRPSTSWPGSDVSFSSDVSLGLVHKPSSSTFSADRNVPAYNQQCNSTIYKRDIKLKSMPVKPTVKQVPVNGLSSAMLAGRSIPHRTSSSDPQILEDYIFTDDSTNSKTIQLNQADPSGRRGRLSQDSKLADITVSNPNTSLSAVSNSDQYQVLSGNTAAPNVDFQSWPVHSSTQNATIHQNHPVQGTTASTHSATLGENWATEFLSLLDSSDQSKTPSVSSSQNFSYTLRDNNFLTFSNDTSNIAEISNT